jgi:hypothetical protein
MYIVVVIREVINLVNKKEHIPYNSRYVNCSCQCVLNIYYFCSRIAYSS